LKCKICGSENTKNLFVKPDKTGLAKCLDCGVFFTEPKPEESLIKSFYNNSDYFNHWFKYKNVKLNTDMNRFEGILKFVSKPEKLLDFGCGPGFFLNIAKSKCGEVYGIEYSDFAIDYAKKELNLNIEKFCGFPLRFKDNYFDVITIWHALEHLENPKEIIDEFRRILKPNGLLVIEIPNVHGLLSIIRGKKALPLIEHLFHFNAGGLSTLLNNSGFKILSITPGKPGYTRTGIKILIKKALAALGYFIYKISGLNYGDAILAYCEKK